MAASEAAVTSSSSLKTDTCPVLETAGTVAAMAATPASKGCSRSGCGRGQDRIRSQGLQGRFGYQAAVPERRVRRAQAQRAHFSRAAESVEGEAAGRYCSPGGDQAEAVATRGEAH